MLFCFRMALFLKFNVSLLSPVFHRPLLLCFIKTHVRAKEEHLLSLRLYLYSHGP